MSDTTNGEEPMEIEEPTDTLDDDGLPKVDELKLLKQRATMMGIVFSNNISVPTLRAKIAAKMEGTDQTPPPPSAPTNFPPMELRSPGYVHPLPAPNPLESQPAPASAPPMTASRRKQNKRMEMQRKYLKLIRCRIQNLDPKKKDLHGEVFTIGNELIGTVSKFIPYGEVTDDGYHVPFCLFQMLDQRRFVHITVTKDRRTQREIVKTTMAKEFALEILPQLTKQQLIQLATAQAAAGSVPGNTE